MCKWLASFLMLVLLIGCSENQPVSPEAKPTNKATQALIQEMEWVEHANIESLAQSRLKSSKRFLAVMNDGEVVIPGLAKDLCELVVSNGDYEVLPGMSEVVYNSRHAELRVKTRDFAKAYNQKLINMIKANT